MKLHGYKCQGHSLTLIQGRSDFKIKTFVCLVFFLVFFVGGGGGGGGGVGVWQGAG